MTVSSYDSTYESTPTTSEDSMFGAPIYARRTKGQDKNNKIFLGAAAAGVLIAVGALFWATSAANDGDASPTVAAAQPMAPALSATPAMPVTTPVTPAVQPVLETAQVQPAIRSTPAATRRAAPRIAPAPQTRVAASAPSATDSGANVSSREYAPVTPAIEEPAAAPMIMAEPPAAAPVPVVPVIPE